jgi:HPt (histidine-containing phosphotransfer) domain-containing protein
VEEIKESLAIKDLEKAQALTHTLKGLAGNLSAVELQAAALALEADIKKGQLDDAEAKLAAVQVALNQVLESVRNMAEPVETQTAEGPSMTLSEITPLLAKLGELLAAYDTEAKDIADSLTGSLSDLGAARDAQKLCNQIGKFDFGGAQETLKRIADTIGAAL